MKVELSIIIPTLNRASTLKNCVESIHQHTNVSYEIIVYANACTDETYSQIDAIENIQIIADKENKFFTEAVNIGIARSTGRYVFLLNDDTLLLRNDWFETYRDFLELDERIAVVGPYWKNIDELPYGWIEPYASLYKRSTFDTFGLLPYYDESFVLWWSDIYHAYNLMKNGQYIFPLSREFSDRYVHHLRDGESGDTVLQFKDVLPENNFRFHGKELMYERLNINSETELVGYYQGRVWNEQKIAV